ncbi:hypothetical protein MRX96_057050 [Rhipicephalus microplus]
MVRTTSFSLAGTKALNNLAARAQLLDPAPLVQYQDRSLRFPISVVSQLPGASVQLAGQSLVVNQPYQDCRLKMVGTA